MSLFDKRMSKEEKASLELAEDSRQHEWKHPSFAARLFQGTLDWSLIHPYPGQPDEDREIGDQFLKRLSDLLKQHLDPDKVDETREIPLEVIKGLREMGAFAIKIPKKYGGLGLSQTNYNRAVHLVGSYCGSTAALLSAHQSIGVPQPLIDFGTEEQKEKFLPRFGKGAISGFALTEEEAGSDPRRMRTTAKPTDDGKYYILNGEKLWCTNGNIADILMVMAQTPPKMVRGKEKKQITAFIVETNTPGFEVVYRCKFVGLNAIQNGVIRFTNVRVPKENVVLGEGQGLKLAFVTLNTGRLTLPAAVAGMSKWCLSVARRWARERKQWGALIGDHEAIAAKISQMAAAVFAMDAITWLVSSMVDRKSCDIRLEAAMAKLFCTEESWKVLYDTIQVRGGRGYETGPSLKGRGKAGYPLERAMRDSRVNTILEGSSEIMHLFIAREALDFHLKKMQALFNPKVPVVGKIKAALSAGITYLFWYPSLWIPCACGPSSAGPLKAHLKFIRSASKRLARGQFHSMMAHQKKMVSKQNLLNRFVDIGLDLFAMSAACSYAEYLMSKGEDKKNSAKLANLFCRIGTDRVKNRFRELRRNHDKLSVSVSKDVLADAYTWLESDIIDE